MRMRLQESLAVVSLILTFVGVPAFGKIYQRAQDVKLMGKQPGAVRVFNVTGVAHRGVWTTEEVVGHNYWRRTPKEATLVVREGERVVLRVKSADVTHALYIPELNVGPVTTEPGHVEIAEFVARPPGVYTIYCMKMCGDCHFFMRGTLVIEGRDGKSVPPSEVAAVRRFCPLHALAPPPQSAPAVERGKWLYLRFGCVACHGAEGRGKVRNPNTEGNEVPALYRLADTIVNDQQEAQRLLALIERRLRQGKSLNDLRRQWLTQYHDLKKRILEGRQPDKEDPNGPIPPLYMPTYKGKMKSADLDALMAYIISLFPEEEWKSWDE